MGFLRFLACPRDPLRRFVWSRLKNSGLLTISAGRARPSAEIRVVEVQKLGAFYDFCGARATLCGDSRGRSSTTVDFLRFLLAARDPLRRSCASKRSRCGAVNILARETAFGSCLVVRTPAFAMPRSRVRFPPGNVVRGACSCSSGWKIVTFKYRRSARSVLPQLRLENRNF